MDNVKNIDAMDTFEVSILTSTVDFVLMSDDISELWFIEDIYSFCMKGKLTFLDKVGFIEFGGVSGTEVVKIVYGQKENKKYVIFNIHNTKTVLISESEYRVEVDLIDLTFKNLNYHTYSLSYKNNTPYTDIIKDIANRYLYIKDYQLLEDGKEKLPYFNMDNTTPAENIKWLMKRCSGKTSGQPGYLFYQNTTEKQWNMVTLETLLQQKKKMFIFDKDEMYTTEDVNSDNVNKIQSHQIQGVSNKYIPDISRGYLLGYDPMSKILYHKVYTYLDAIKRYTILGKHTLFEGNQIASYMKSESDPINTGETSLSVMDNMWFGNWIKTYCIQQLVEINVKGHELRYAGGMIEIVWKSKDTKEEKLNQSLSGKFLIKSITHHFSHTRTPKYQQVIILMKNGFGEKQEGNFIKANKMNI